MAHRSLVIIATLLAGVTNSAPCPGDNTPPVFEGCPSGLQELVTEAGQNYAVFTYTLKATDDCDGVILDSPISEQYTVGTTPVQLVLPDSSGNQQECSFDVKVVDQEAPVLQCPTNATFLTGNPTLLKATIGCNLSPLAPEAYVAGTVGCTISNVFDNDVIQGSSVSPSLLSIGTHTVTATVIDPSGNSQSCVFQAVVIRNPQLSAGEGLTQVASVVEGELDVEAVDDLALLLEDISSSLTADDNDLIELVSFAMTSVVTAGTSVGLSGGARSSLTSVGGTLLSLRLTQGSNRLSLATECGTGTCEVSETCHSCPQDCGSCTVPLGGPGDQEYAVYGMWLVGAAGFGTTVVSGRLAASGDHQLRFVNKPEARNRTDMVSPR